MNARYKIVKMVSSLIIVLSLITCGETYTSEEHEKSMTDLSASEQLKRDSLERIYIATLDEIDSNLDEIRERHGMLILGPNSNGDFIEPKKDQIINNITMINNLLENNRRKIAALEKSLDKYIGGKKELIRSIQLAKEKALIQEESIQELKQLLTERDFKIEELSYTLLNKDNQLSEMSNTNKIQETKLNQAYFAYGTSKQLKEKKIIKEKGGVLGIRRVKLLDENLDKREFTEIDKSKVTSIIMLGKKPKLITIHLKSSYDIKHDSDDVTTLTIKNPEKFWEVSRYLVIELH